MYYRVCQKCGAALDPGERCDCEHEKEKERARQEMLYSTEKKTNQLTFNLQKVGA